MKLSLIPILAFTSLTSVSFSSFALPHAFRLVCKAEVLSLDAHGNLTSKEIASGAMPVLVEGAAGFDEMAPQVPSDPSSTDTTMKQVEEISLPLKFKLSKYSVEMTGKASAFSDFAPEVVSGSISLDVKIPAKGISFSTSPQQRNDYARNTNEVDRVQHNLDLDGSKYTIGCSLLP